MKAQLTRTSMLLSGAHLEMMKKISEQTGLSVSDHFRRGVEGYIDSYFASAPAQGPINSPHQPQVPQIDALQAQAQALGSQAQIMVLQEWVEELLTLLRRAEILFAALITCQEKIHEAWTAAEARK